MGLTAASRVFESVDARFCSYLIQSAAVSRPSARLRVAVPLHVWVTEPPCVSTRTGVVYFAIRNNWDN
jgi:hypothetical protein